jgi:exonuclease SbcC
MLNWLFRRRDNEAARPAQAVAQPPAGPTGSAKARPVEAITTDWAAQLQQAQGDDAALLRVAQSAAPLDIKLAAVQGLATEGTLRQAEREFRSHDRKVHRLAKQRLEAAVTQREARASAQALIERTRALLGEAQVSVNHVVALDREWNVLPAQALEPAQCTRFAELRASLDAAMRAHAEEQQHLQRWSADVRRGLPEWQRAIAAAAEHGGTQDIALLTPVIAALRDACPDVPATAELAAALAQMAQSAARVERRLAWLEAQPATAADPVPARVAAPDASPDVPAADDMPAEPTQTAVEAGAPTTAVRWEDLPSLPDGELARLLSQRHESWLHASRPARRDLRDMPPAASKPLRSGADEAAQAKQRQRLETLVQQAEDAIASGHISDVQQPLKAIDATLHGAAMPEALRARHHAVRAEMLRLKDWQQWGGARARDELADEAEALARDTLAAADEQAAQRPKLNLKSHGESIHALRMRWKELDRLGTAARLDLWQRFDAALQAAHQPVAAQHAALQAARVDNQRSREALLSTLDALALPDASSPAGDAATASWKELQREWERFQQAWRKLGPIAHTVPAEAREPLQQRLRTSTERVHAPLQAAIGAASALRESLIVRAQALASDVVHHHVADATRLVRELQTQWQDHARQMPLPRAVESELWSRFKAATDAVFAQRDAAFAARDAELAASLAARESLLGRLSALDADTPASAIERTLAEVDRAWRQTGEAPRGAAESLDARYRSARAAASQQLSAGIGKRWQAQCEALAARLALCEEREDINADDAGLDERWSTLDALPAAWQQSLALRWARPVAPGPLPEAAVDELLLQLEAALDLPIAPEWQAARRQLKLHALKQAFEARPGPRQGPSVPADGLLAALCQSGLGAAQRARLHAVIAGLRAAAPGSLGLPTLAP